MRIVATLGLVVIAVSVTGCSRNREALPHNDPAVKAYGYGPRPNPNVRYQPDVIMIGGGPKAIRGVSDDDLTWTIDANAEGADQLGVGKIMFATSRAVGRVTALEHRGKNLAVTLGPVQFTEVVRDATIDLDTTLDSKLLADEQFPPARLVPELPPAGAQAAVVRPAVWHPNAGRARLEPVGDKTDAWKGSFKVKAGNWEIEPYLKLKGEPGGRLSVSDPYNPTDENIQKDYANKKAPPEYEQKARDPNLLVKKEEEKATEFGLKVLYSPYGGEGDAGLKDKDVKKPGDKPKKPDLLGAPKYGLKFGYSMRLGGENIRIRSHLGIVDGKVNGPITFVIDGIDRMHLGFLGGTENKDDGNIKSRIEVPWEQGFQLPPVEGLPIPLAVHLKFKFLVETAFSGANSTMWGGGDYQLIGPFGVQNGVPVSPTVQVVNPMSENIHGLTVGVSAIVVATEYRFLVGIGNNSFVAGPYMKTIITFATVKGSFLTFGLGGPLSSPFGALAKCRGIKLKGDTGGGIGVVIDKNVAASLKVMPTELEIENMDTFFDKEYRVGCPTADK